MPMPNFTDLLNTFSQPLQVFFCIAMIILIMWQQRGAALSSTFGGGNQVYLTRRGIEKWIVTFTVLSIAGFLIVRFLSLYF